MDSSPPVAEDASTPDPQNEQPSRLPNMLRALRYRNYRLFFGGQLVSLIGTWLNQIAMAWLVYDLTGSSVLLGTVAFSSQIPAFFISPMAGVLSDRTDLRRVLVMTQILSMAQSLTMAYLTLSGAVTVPLIITLAIVQGLINGFDLPARQAFVVQMVDDRADLSNAIALNSSMFNAARLLGPAVGGILIKLTGVGVCFLIDGLSYAAVIVALLMMRPAARLVTPERRHVLHELAEGMTYAWRFKPIRELLILLALTSLLGAPYTVLMPIFAVDVLHGSADTLGYLLGAAGVGALSGAIALASRKSVAGLGRWIFIASLAFGATLVAFSQSQSVLLSMLLLAGSGAGMILTVASANTVLQTLVEDRMRGRVMSLFSMCFQGMMPIGSLLAGWLAKPEHLGPAWTVTLGGTCLILAGSRFATQLPRLRPMVLPIYRAKGIIPEVARGVQAATNLRVPPND